MEVVAAFEPQRLFFRNIRKGQKETRVIRVDGKRAGEVELGEVKSSSPAVAVEPIEQDGKPALRVTFTAPEQEGRFSARVTAASGLDKPKQLRLYVAAQVTGDLVVDKRYVIFPRFDAADPPEQQLEVRSLAGEPFRITKVEDPAGAVEGSASQQNGKWLVELKLTRAPAGARGNLQLHTDRADQKVLRLNYHVRHRKPRVQRPGRRSSAGKRRLIKLQPGGKPRIQLDAAKARKRLPLKLRRGDRAAETDPKR